MRSTAWCRVVRSSVYSTTTRIRRWQRALRIYEAKWGKGLNSGGMKVSARTIVNPQEWAKPWQFAEAWPPPAQATSHATGTDVLDDVPLLYALGRAVQPAVIVELGTRHGVSTRTLAFLAQLIGATFYTVDPDPRCEGFIKDILHPEHCIFLNMTGEHAFSAGAAPRPDMLFLDTDPP